VYYPPLSLFFLQTPSANAYSRSLLYERSSRFSLYYIRQALFPSQQYLEFISLPPLSDYQDSYYDSSLSWSPVSCSYPSLRLNSNILTSSRESLRVPPFWMPVPFFCCFRSLVVPLLFRQTPYGSRDPQGSATPHRVHVAPWFPFISSPPCRLRSMFSSDMKTLSNIYQRPLVRDFGSKHLFFLTLKGGYSRDPKRPFNVPPPPFPSRDER